MSNRLPRFWQRCLKHGLAWNQLNWQFFWDHLNILYPSWQLPIDKQTLPFNRRVMQQNHYRHHQIMVRKNLVHLGTSLNDPRAKVMSSEIFLRMVNDTGSARSFLISRSPFRLEFLKVYKCWCLLLLLAMVFGLNFTDLLLRDMLSCFWQHWDQIYPVESHIAQLRIKAIACRDLHS